MSLSMMLTTAAMWVNARPIRLALTRDDYLETLDPGRRPAEPPARLRRSGRVVVSRQDGLPVYRYEPATRTPGLELMYLPGGGLVNPLVTEHWWIVERLARATGAAITVVCYPLAPERGADDTLTVIDAHYERLAARAGTSRLLVAGDSAGGAVAVGLSLRAARRPDGLVLFSPWLDLALTNPAIARRVSRDPSLRVPGLRAGAEAWVGDRGLDDPALNPARMGLAGLPPTLVFQGGRDIFFDDAVAFSRRARAERASARLVTGGAGFHVYAGAFWTPEARAAYALVGAFSCDPARVSHSGTYVQ
ncbi:alpha/beta hydrolase fold domain-containing protein [Microbacterium sp. PRF11]|uniref:alpha/beta hydrolase fold domain-containing protein n=1 Tax=Microbacterium sp. PRF11 TaxID=2962593 RepID=UPI002881F680|nr:alpha/beta hydrolase fold domain-containing protein [Microbacterium sp. PRF11]MDT0116842.1 alpha/beta hydrolase fold domain-containing protein [Microbacterium sp. PRF11]